jgi:hypothetical protein
MRDFFNAVVQVCFKQMPGKNIDVVEPLLAAAQTRLFAVHF